MDYSDAHVATAPWHDPSKEALVAIIVNTRRRVIGHNLLALGGLHFVAFHPREIFRPVIVAAGSAVNLAHNYPSGDPTPSDSDIRATRDIHRAGQVLKIELLDHVIVGTDFRSMRAMGFMG